VGGISERSYIVIPKLVEESCGVATYFLALFHPTILPLPSAKISPFRYRSSKTLKCLRYDEMTRNVAFEILRFAQNDARG
jgi:hypothetical protein